MISFVTPLVALILGMLYRKERFEATSVLGSFLVISGVFLVVVVDNLRKTGRYSVKG